MNKLILRAITAYSRTDLKSSEGALGIKGRETTYLGKQYLLIESDQGEDLLAVYRCMNRGELKRLKRWRSEVTAKVQTSAVSKKIETQANAPAILELSPLKHAPRAVKAKRAKANALKVNKNQTDLFE